MPSANYVAQSGQFYGGIVQGNPTGGVMTGIDRAIGNAVTGDIDYARQLESLGFQNAFNASEAQKQRDFEERMSNTAYQRAVADMRKAGLNPYLAYSQGGASTPTGYASTSGSGVASRSMSDNFVKLLGNLVNLVAGMATTSMKTSAQLASTATKANSAITVANTAQERHVYHYNRR
ncbi:DNA pilot protein [Chicken microvirus mg6_218]|nr:DNA pilot protein [Chicken microvirus mg6_218]